MALAIGLLQVPENVSGGQITIACHFDQTASTEVQVTPSAAAQQTLAPNAEEDSVDEFAAGYAAPQTEAQHQSNGASQEPSVIDDNLIDEFAAGDATAQVQVRDHGALQPCNYLVQMSSCLPFCTHTSI